MGVIAGINGSGLNVTGAGVPEANGFYIEMPETAVPPVGWTSPKAVKPEDQAEYWIENGSKGRKWYLQKNGTKNGKPLEDIEKHWIVFNNYPTDMNVPGWTLCDPTCTNVNGYFFLYYVLCKENSPRPPNAKWNTAGHDKRQDLDNKAPSVSAVGNGSSKKALSFRLK